MTDWEDHEDPADSDIDDPSADDSVDLAPCPHCRKPVYDHAEVCPHCGSYISAEDAPRRRHPRWIVIVAILLLGVILFGWTFRFMR